MTLDEAIAHALEKGAEGTSQCALDHLQLAHWLEELRSLRASQPYQRGNRDGLLSFATECKRREVLEQETAEHLGKHPTLGQRLAVNHYHAAEAWRKASQLASTAAQALPDDPEVQVDDADAYIESCAPCPNPSAPRVARRRSRTS